MASERPVGVVGRGGVECHLPDLDPVCVDLSERAGDAAVVGESGGNETGAVTEISSAAGSLEEGFSVGGVSDLALSGSCGDVLDLEVRVLGQDLSGRIGM